MSGYVIYVYIFHSQIPKNVILFHTCKDLWINLYEIDCVNGYAFYAYFFFHRFVDLLYMSFIFYGFIFIPFMNNGFLVLNHIFFDVSMLDGNFPNVSIVS